MFVTFYNYIFSLSERGGLIVIHLQSGVSAAAWWIINLINSTTKKLHVLYVYISMKLLTPRLEHLSKLIRPIHLIKGFDAAPTPDKPHENTSLS
jgi:hypothetical protein